MSWLSEIPEVCPDCGEEVYSWQKHKCKKSLEEKKTK